MVTSFLDVSRLRLYKEPRTEKVLIRTSTLDYLSRLSIQQCQATGPASFHVVSTEPEHDRSSRPHKSAGLAESPPCTMCQHHESELLSAQRSHEQAWFWTRQYWTLNSKYFCDSRVWLPLVRTVRISHGRKRTSAGQSILIFFVQHFQLYRKKSSCLEASFLYVALVESPMLTT
jgi:hypothetical protein